MSVDSAACTETVGEELVEITSGGKTYLVPKAFADEVLRRRRLEAARRVGPLAAAPKKTIEAQRAPSQLGRLDALACRADGPRSSRAAAGCG